jgi:hypothetical protein
LRNSAFHRVLRLRSSGSLLRMLGAHPLGGLSCVLLLLLSSPPN